MRPDNQGDVPPGSPGKEVFQEGVMICVERCDGSGERSVGWIMGLDNVKAIGDLHMSSFSGVVRARTFCKFQQEQ